VYYIEKSFRFNLLFRKIIIFNCPKSIKMRNLPVSYPKIVMWLFFTLVIFYSCAEDEKVVFTSMENIFEDSPPIAIPEADKLSGAAPIQINFSAINSYDDGKIISYYWEFPNDTSSSSNTSYTFNQAGVYIVTLTTTDDANQTNSATLTITVSEAENDSNSEDNFECVTKGGKANESGLKTWCWDDISLPTYSNSKGESFSNNQLTIDSECNENALSISDGELHFFVDPVNPPTDTTWCVEDFNMRAEVRTNPWQVQHPLGTEEWFGWSYTFGDDYKIDTSSPFLFFQLQQGVPGSPPIELAVVPSSLYGASNGEVAVLNFANLTETDRTLTGFIPNAGTTLDIVVHVVHDLGSKGLLQVWINGSQVYNKQVGTVYEASPWGGNAKFGIYKWKWREASGVQLSANQGITHLKTSMGTLRIITRKPTDADYLTDSFSLVAP
jgi:PKD repeat protein